MTGGKTIAHHLLPHLAVNGLVTGAEKLAKGTKGQKRDQAGKFAGLSGDGKPMTRKQRYLASKGASLGLGSAAVKGVKALVNHPKGQDMIRAIGRKLANLRGPTPKDNARHIGKAGKSYADAAVKVVSGARRRARLNKDVLKTGAINTVAIGGASAYIGKKLHDKQKRAKDGKFTAAMGEQPMSRKQRYLALRKERRATNMAKLKRPKLTGTAEKPVKTVQYKPGATNVQKPSSQFATPATRDSALKSSQAWHAKNQDHPNPKIANFHREQLDSVLDKRGASMALSDPVVRATIRASKKALPMIQKASNHVGAKILKIAKENSAVDLAKVVIVVEATRRGIMALKELVGVVRAPRGASLGLGNAIGHAVGSVAGTVGGVAIGSRFGRPLIGGIAGGIAGGAIGRRAGAAIQKRMKKPKPPAPAFAMGAGEDVGRTVGRGVRNLVGGVARIATAAPRAIIRRKANQIKQVAGVYKGLYKGVTGAELSLSRRERYRLSLG
jgi:hypothetical protein